ncbi:MAG: hypothetical protein ACE5H0_00055 [Bacteroidota bacterium]
MRWVLVLVALHLVATSFAQRPVLVTEEPFTLGDGNQVIGLGFEYLRKSSSDEGISLSRLWKVPVLQVEVGLGERVNFQLHWRGGLFARSSDGANASDFGDLFLATKILILRETHGLPALGFKYAVKLPMTGDEKGLGSDNTDFFGSLLFSRKIGIVASRLNLGIGILGHPRAQNAQDDIYTYGAALLLPIKQSVALFVETAGFFGPFEDDDKLVGRLGLQVRRFDLGWAAFGGVKLSGTPRDFSTAFELSERWGIGVFVSKDMQLW